MDRRRYLALAGTGISLAIAGCTSGDGDDDNGGDTGGDDSTDDGAADDSGGENGGSTGDGSSDDGGSDGSENGSDGGDNGTDDDSSNGGENGDDNGGDDSSDGDENGSDNGSSFSDATELLQLSALGERDPPYFGERTTVSGTGDAVSEPFYLVDGMVGFVYDHDGESNFIAEVVDPNTGDTLSVVINEIGTVAGAGAVPSAVGAYQLDIQADGQWEIVVVEPSPPKDAVRTPPVDVEGAGNAVVGPVSLTGGETVTASHDGESNFIVTAIAESATSSLDTELAVNEIGSVDSAQTILSVDAWAWININADGEWSLTLE